MKKPSDDITATVTALRAQIAATTAELQTIAGAPLPCPEAEDALVASVDRLAKLYDPTPVLAAFIRPGGGDLGTVELLVPDPQ